MNLSQINEIAFEADDRYPPLLQVLLAVQDENPNHYISESAVGEIARALHVTRGRVYSTASFYSEISLTPRGRNIIRVCINAPCENAGKKEILEALKEILGITIGETTDDGEFTMESVNCLGACYMSPAIKINDQIFGDLTREDLPGIIQKFRKERKEEEEHATGESSIDF
ncbi:complex I 24 kDa subunit family protein [Sinanaerobacter chloroacetimidivorans]|jgi:NADH:ubiquinone oxidoreductase subunit E|uniref:NAD(P)H-dependent oxidoreductase subunit E n=1 Tax=Sinanaerobacter chloroacetimidivorans TaxID=2818044 RepID=A0A8J7VY11_9FIRM|nr:NAD(P)H-dependent oxidoreductase subunit E [Sinanaerobacter chloroacetimidivorans]MBR0596839.1 NAD(P)H-dependent oxidoreductase subunit E [Sinanaerobacter chloroacetimidivorans]